MAEPLALPRPIQRIAFALLAVAAIACVAAWLWRCLCLFPIHGWNEVRLAPVFQWLHFGSPYPPPGAGPATTWIYGPVPLIALSPVVFARSAAEALMSAGVINLCLTVSAIGAVCLGFRPAGQRPSLVVRFAAALACIAIWPGTTFRFFQADNVGVVCGLWSLLLLQRSSTSGGRWLAAAACAAAFLCKQTLIGLFAAEVIWVYLQSGRGAALAHVSRTALFAVTGFGLAALAWGPGNLGYHLVALPARLPWVDSAAARIALYWPELIFHFGLPILLLACFGGRWRRRESTWQLPALAFIATAPLSLMAFFKIGGSTNSLHGALFLLPFAAAQIFGEVRGQAFRTTAAFAIAGLAALGQLASVAPGTWTPRFRHLTEGDSLTRQLSGELLLPWHPLITYFAEQRIDETDDGLLIRSLAGDGVRRDQAQLPPRFHAMAFRKGESDWGMARSLVPAGAQASDYGLWTVYSWSAAPVPMLDRESSQIPN